MQCPRVTPTGCAKRASSLGQPGPGKTRSLIYTHSGDIYKATIGRPRKRYAGSPQPGSAKAAHGEGEESGSAVIAIVVTDRQVEIWSQEPAQGWANPSLVRHDDITSIQYLSEGPAEPLSPQ